MASVTPDVARRAFAEEIRAGAGIQSAALIEALAAVPRERFLGPGPSQVRGAADVGGPPRTTEDADPSRVYQDVSVAVDAARNLYNGQPSLVAKWLDTLDLRPGHHAVHIGCGTGYFTALIAHVVGTSGTVEAMDVDSTLVARARDSLRDYPWVALRAANGATLLTTDADRILVHAGATHVLDAWLDALADGGRLLVPLTVEFPGMPPGIGKGVMLLVTRRGADWSAQTLATMPVAIYSMREVRDTSAADRVSAALMNRSLTRISRLRRDRHEPADTCIVHSSGNCLSA